MKNSMNGKKKTLMMESVLVLFKLIICLIILPLCWYLRKHGYSINMNTLKSFFTKEYNSFVYYTIKQVIKDHPIAAGFLVKGFLENTFGRILMRFSLFRGFVNIIKSIEHGIDSINQRAFEFLGTTLINPETLYAIQYMGVVINSYKENKGFDHFKAAAIILTLVDLILCSTNSYRCKALKPIENSFYVVPIFLEIGISILAVTMMTADGYSKGYQYPLEYGLRLF